MSLECGICEHDLRSGHMPDCPMNMSKFELAVKTTELTAENKRLTEELELLKVLSKPLFSRRQLESTIAAQQQTVGELREALENTPCNCWCNVHGYGCGVHEATCELGEVCERCKALAKLNESKL